MIREIEPRFEISRAADEIPVVEPLPPLLLTIRWGENVVPLVLGSATEMTALKRLQLKFRGTQVIPGSLTQLREHPLWFSRDGDDVPLGNVPREN